MTPTSDGHDKGGPGDGDDDGAPRESPASAPADALAPFRPRRGRFVAQIAMWGSLIVFGGIAVLIPAQALGGWNFADRLMFFGLGVVVAALAWRYMAISALPSRRQLVVRNLVVSRTVEWAEIVGVQFGGGEPWVTLDLVDGDTLAVMAIQKADGPVAQQQASRLAALVQALGETTEPDRTGERPDPPPETGSS